MAALVFAIATVILWLVWPRRQRHAPPIAEHSDMPIDGLTAEERAEFAEGNVLFDAPAREIDGLGPLYIRTSCGACHEDAVRGPGLVQKLADGTSARPLLAAGAKTPIIAGATASKRIGPPLLGRGWIEAVLGSEIERAMQEQQQRSDGIRGRVSRVVYASEPGADERFDPHHKGDLVIGRFGLKARSGALEDFVADALQNDMGLTTVLRPHEPANPDGLVDDAKPGIDIGEPGIRLRTAYVRLLAIPKRPDGTSTKGREIFDRTRCSACHVPSLHTRADYPVRAIADRDAMIYSDLLLHDMGDTLEDGISEGSAGPRDWRTAPLIGLRFLRQLMHDGRASGVAEAIRAHGGEAAPAVALFEALGEPDRVALVEFVSGL